MDYVKRPRHENMGSKDSENAARRKVIQLRVEKAEHGVVLQSFLWMRDVLFF